MTAALGNTAQGTPYATGVDAFVYPQFIGYALRAPTTQDIYNPGTQWQNNAVNPPVIYETTGAGRWYSTAGGGETLTALTVTGPSSLTGVTNINTTGAAATSIGTGGTGVTNIGNATGGTVVTGAESVSGILTASSGINTAPTIVAAAASPQTANNRSGQVTFSGVSIAAGATETFVINNTAVNTSVLVAMSGATAGSALSIVSITNVAATSITIVVTNGTGATTDTANITFTFLCLN